MEQPPPSSGIIELTLREYQVLSLASEGLTSRQIARELGLSRSTVDKMLSDAENDPRPFYWKLGARNRPEAVRKFTELIRGKDTGPTDLDPAAFEVISLQSFLEEMNLDLQETQQAMDEGFPEQATNRLGIRILPKLRAKAVQMLRHAPQRSWPILDLLSSAVFQFGNSTSYWMSHRQGAWKLRTSANELDWIATVCDHPLPRTLAYSHRSSASHLVEDFAASERYANWAHDLLEPSVEDNIRITVLGLLASAQAKINKGDEAMETTKAIQETIQKATLLRPAMLRGGLLTMARVDSELGNRRSFWGRLETARKEVQTREGQYGDRYNGLRLIYTELKGMRSLKEPDLGRVEELMKHASLISTQHSRLFQEVEISAQRVLAPRGRR